MISVDVAVVGGGMAGASVAAELAPHASVALLEREPELGYHTTARSAAQFQESIGSATIRVLTRASRAVLEAIGEEVGTPVLRPRQTLWVGRPEDRGRLEALVAGGAVEQVGAAEALARCPALREDHVAVAAVERGSQDVDVDLVFQHYLRAARRSGVQVLRGAELLAARRSGSGWLLSTAQGDVSASVVVDAAGAWADEVATLLGARRLDLRPLRRTALVARVSARPIDPDWPMVVDVADRFYFRPESGGVLASPADETPTAPSDARPDELDVALTLERLNDATDLAVRSVVRAWAGLRTFAPDRLPVVGFGPDVPGLMWLAGQGGFGIQIAPALAILACGLLTKGAVPAGIAGLGFDAGSLSPTRFRREGRRGT
ncbi:NAD(P)/FAD-dependent oxidoreductase [Actinopolymorpha pittospori]